LSLASLGRIDRASNWKRCPIAEEDPLVRCAYQTDELATWQMSNYPVVQHSK